MIYVLFFVSGACGLIYELAWIRQLGLILGNTTYATSCVLAEFLLGLAMGAALGGQYIDRNIDAAKSASDQSQPYLIIYGILEIVIGISALICTYLLVAMPDVFANLYLHSQLPESLILAVQFLATFIILIVPTIFMGATLPVLTCFLKQSLDANNFVFALLYGVNTLGAGLGVIFACFYGFGLLGIQGSVLAACLLNVVVGLIAFAICAHNQKEKISVLLARFFSSQILSVGHLSIEIRLPKERDLWVMYMLSFTSGFVALSYEVVWARLLRPLTSSSTYAISFMLFAFLIALASASLIWSFWLTRRKAQGQSDLTIDRLTMLFSFAQSGGALCFVLSYLLVPLAYRYQAAFSAYRGAASEDLDKLLFAQGLSSFAFVFLPTMIIGLCFPICGTFAQQMEKTGRTVGTAYALNTLGSILGSLITGFILIGLMGGTIALKVITLVSVVSAVIACLIAGNRRSLVITSMSVPIALLFFALVPSSYVVEQMASAVNARLVKTYEDATGTAWVFDYPDFRMLLLNGESYSADVPWARRYMRFMGHLPVLLCDQPKETLLIGFGAGITCGAMIQDERVKHVDVAELSKAVVDASQSFTDANQDALLSGKLSMKYEDGRNWLLRSCKTYDVIVVSPPLPNDAQVVNLYTKEFYRLARQHLAADGIFCQWVPMEHESELLWKITVKAACTQFAHVAIFMPVHHEAILLASNSDIVLDANVIDSRIGQSQFVQKSLKSIELPDAQAILQTTLVSEKKLNKYLQDVEPLSDEKPALEFFLPYAGKKMEPELIN